MLGTAQLNLAGLLKVSGEIAGAIEHFEAAADMGRRSGRRSTARAALLNLANTDLYLGRLARARQSIESLEAQRSELPPVGKAQLDGLAAELAARSGSTEQAIELYEACATAYEALGRATDAAEARLEAVLLVARTARPDLTMMRSSIDAARTGLADSSAHGALLHLASARLHMLKRREEAARADLEEALQSARGAGQREWVWRALEARAELAEESDQLTLARRDREEALSVLEAIGARLPRDLREVYWNDPRRRDLRNLVQARITASPTEVAQYARPVVRNGDPLGHISEMTVTPLEQRLARILEINSELAGELDLERITARVTSVAVEFLRAERGHVLLCEQDGSLTVRASRSRSGSDANRDFSRSVARDAIRDGRPVVSVSARDDARLAEYQSVHQLELQSVACVPIFSPKGQAIGALYLETRVRPGDNFEREIPTLKAFADQVAIAIETARLVGENRRRADELAATNSQLREAQGQLKELLEMRTTRLKETRRKLRDARDTLYGHFGYKGLVGTSAAMRRVYSLIERIKDTDVPILITGESGTGKEVVARAIHSASNRSKQKFLGVNCGAIPEHLLESELFGHVRGAFTSADRDKKGLFREAEGGGILLDEIGETPHKMQAGLLRVLQERKVRPVGGTGELPVDVRVMFATNRDLAAMVEEGTFREDLYYRIHVVEVALPALRDRVDDIPPLVDHFLGIFAARYKREKGSVTRGAMRRLKAYSWPGNVRQLEHVLLNAWVLAEDPELGVDDFDIPDGHQPASSQRPPASSGRSRSRSKITSRAKSTLSQHRSDERDKILKALQACNWNRVKAAELAGIPRRTFYRRLREYGIQ